MAAKRGDPGAPREDQEGNTPNKSKKELDRELDKALPGLIPGVRPARLSSAEQTEPAGDPRVEP